MIEMASQYDEYVQSLIKEVAEASKAVPQNVLSDNEARKNLQAAAARLSQSLRSPIEHIRQLIFQVLH